MPIITIKQGDNLSKLASQYGVTVADLMKANPTISNPNLIYAGKTLNIPGAEPTLDKTLPAGDQTGGVNAGTAVDKTLPASAPDNLTIFGNLLKTVSERAANEANASGMSVTGINPSAISGGTLAGVVDFIKNQKGGGIQDIYKSTADFLDNQQKSAQDQLKTLVDSGAIANLTDSALAKLATAAGMSYDTLDAVRKAKATDNTKPVSFSEVTRNGKKIRLGFDKNGQVVSETDLHADASSGDGTGFSGLSSADKSKVIGWAANQAGFAQSDINKMNEDSGFADFILSKYYQSDEYKTAQNITSGGE
ncbi:MAG: LysM domain-containing protein [Candidatus Staskawiczbacteria bacterium]|nr:LysM domain-containing protein [Candidatus Staskawiczbacteria bacterium]